MANYEINGVQYPSVSTVIGQMDKSQMLLPWAVKMMAKRIDEEVHSTPKELWDRVELAKLIELGRKEYKLVSDTAKYIGTEVHDKIKDYIRGGKDATGPMKDEVENAFLAFLEWEFENIDKWLESEKKIHHPELYYAGTLDAIALMKDGVVRLLDFKTSKGFYDGFAEQLSGYRNARQYLSDYGIEKTVYKHKSYIDGIIYDFDVAHKKIDIQGMGILRLDKITGKPEFKIYDDKYERMNNHFICLLEGYYHQKKRRLKNNPRVY